MSKNLLLSASILLGLGATVIPTTFAQAQAVGTLYYYNLPSDELRDHYVAWKNFIEYENREQCQHYWAPPAGYEMRGCRVYSLETVQPVKLTEEETPRLLPIISTYTIYFNFDHSDVNANQKPTLDRIAAEIERYHPTQVTVSGYTDTVGTDAYNMALSQRRAKAVAQALNGEGIQNQIIDKEAYGETNLAVQTGEGVRNQDNRRVVVDFRQ